jgi:predicted nucleotidyltransferase
VPRPATADLEALLRELQGAGIEFIVVGGAAAVIHGAPITTQDLDIVPRQDPPGLTRLHATLERLDARFRPVRADRDLAPTLEHVAGTGQLNLITKHGPLDILLRLHDGRGYEELLAHTTEVHDESLRVRVIDLDTLIEIKKSTGRTRDAMVVPLLLAIRSQR